MLGASVTTAQPEITWLTDITFETPSAIANNGDLVGFGNSTVGGFRRIYSTGEWIDTFENDRTHFYAISDDGAVLGGTEGDLIGSAFWFDGQEKFGGTGDSLAPRKSVVIDVSFDGLSAGGAILRQFNSDPARVVSWLKGSNGVLLNGGMPAEDNQHWTGHAIAGNGTYIVGGDGTNAIRWVLNSPHENLGNLGGSNTFATDVNYDGTIVVGVGHTSGNETYAPFRWTAAGGIQELPFFVQSSTAIRVPVVISGDARLVGATELADGGDVGVLWVEGVPQNLGQYISDGGYEGDPIDATAVFAISPDGRFIVGSDRTRGRFIVDMGPALHPEESRMVAYENGEITIESGEDAGGQFRWFHNGEEIPGETGASLTLSNISAEDAGEYSFARVGHQVGWQFSSPTTVAMGSVGDRWEPELWFNSPVFQQFAVAERVVEAPDDQFYVSFYNNGLLDAERTGEPLGALMRLNADGSPDYSFNIGPGFTRFWAIAVQSDGRVIAGGIASSETTQTGPTLYRVFRFNTDGSLDDSFNSPVFDDIPRFITLLADNSMLVVPSGGGSTNGGISTLAYLEADGSMNTSFTEPDLGFGFIFAPPVMDASGRIYIAGTFDSVNGTDRSRVARLNNDGSLDSSWVPSGFNPDFPPQQIRGIALQAVGDNAGKLVVAGGTLLVPGSDDADANRPLIRLNTDGSLDSSFNLTTQADAGMAIRPRLMEVLSDDSITIIGSSVARFDADGNQFSEQDYARPTFSTDFFWMEALDDGSVIVPPQPGSTVNGVDRSRLARFGPDGSLDEGFSGTDFVGTVYPDDFHVYDDGRFLVWGNFDLADTETRPGIARFWSDGAVDGDFAPDWVQPPSYVTQASVAADGKILVSTRNPVDNSSTIVRLNDNASVDDSFQLDGALGDLGGLQARQLDDGKVILLGMNLQRTVDDTITFTLLDNNGTIDNSFDPSGLSAPAEVFRELDDSIRSVTLGEFSILGEDSQGRLIVSMSTGQIMEDASTTDISVVRINRDGSIDQTFDGPTVSWPTLGASFPLYFNGSFLEQIRTTFTGTPFSGVELLDDDSMYIYGLFQNLEGSSASGLARLNSDGSVDTGFDVGDGPAFGGAPERNGQVTGVYPREDGRVFAVGYFDSFDSQDVSGLVQLESNGAVVAGFNSSLELVPYTGGAPGVTSLNVDDRILVSGTYRTEWWQNFPHSFARLRQIPLVEIFAQPRGLTLMPGQGGVLSFGFTDPQADVTFQWYKDGQPIDGATGQELFVSGDDAFLGNYYAEITGGGEILLTDEVGVEYANGSETWVNDDGFTPPEFVTDRFAGRVVADGNGGYFASFVNGSRLTGADGETLGAVVRLNGDGSVDTSFNIGNVLSNAWAILPLDDGSVLVGGEPSTENGLSGLANFYVYKFSASGGLDTSFNSPRLGGLPRFMSMQPDGKIVVIPNGNNGNNGGWRWITRINADGSWDDTFHQVWLNDPVFAPPVFDADGKIYIGGFFSEVDGEYRPGVARLLSDGNVDLEWVPSGFNPDFPPRQVRGLAFQTEGANAGKLLVAGGALMVPDGQGGEINSPVIRLNSDASLDTSFTYVTQEAAGMNPRPRLLHKLADDSFMVVGNTVTRFESDGAIDGDYTMPGFDAEAFWFTVNDDGSAVVPVEPGTNLNGTPSANLVKLLPGGLPDSGFISPQFERFTFPSTFILSGNFTYAVGGFDRVDGVGAPGIAKLNYDGSVDTEFNVTSVTFPDTVVFADQDASGRLVAALQDQNTGERSGIIRLNPDGTLDDSFTLDSSLILSGLEIETRPDDTVLVWTDSAQYIIDDSAGFGLLLEDGSLDQEFSSDDDQPWLGEVYRFGDGSIESITAGDFRVLAVADDGSFLARTTIGDYPQWANDLEHTIRRYHPDGTLDGSFNAPTVWWGTSFDFPFVTDDQSFGGTPFQPPVSRAISPFSGAIMQDDGKVIIFGSFTDLWGFYRPGVARLNADGSVDESFSPGAGPEFLGAPWRIGVVSNVSPAGDDRLWVTGFFDAFGGFSRPGITLLESDGNVVPGFGTNLEFRPWITGSLRAQPVDDGSLLVGGSYEANGGGIRAFHRLSQLQRFVNGELPEWIPFAGGTTVVLDGTVEGIDGATYQWFYNGAPIDGATGPTLSLSDVEPSVEGEYRIEVSDAGGVVLDATTYLDAIGDEPGPGPIYGTGDLPGGDHNSNVRDAVGFEGVVHAVGDGVIGDGYGFGTGGTAGTYWRSDEGLYIIPSLEPEATAAFVAANAITPDARFIAARSRVGFSGVRVPIRVDTSDGAIFEVPMLPDHVAGFGTVLSNDGDTIGGSSAFFDNGNVRWRGFVHDITDDTLIPIDPQLPDSENVFVFGARSMSSDGAVVVGYEQDLDASTNNGRRALRYESGQGTALIPLIGGGTWSSAYATSMDGSITLVGGDSTEFAKGEMYLHDASDDSLTSLGSPWPEANPGNGWGMTGDASVIVGGYINDDFSEGYSYLHNQHGWFQLEEAVVSMGVSLKGWQLHGALGISRDGRFVYGFGERDGLREGFVVEFPEDYLANFTNEDAVLYLIGNLPGATQLESQVRDATWVDGNIHATGSAQKGPEGGIPPRVANAYWSLTDGLQELPNFNDDTFYGTFVTGASITPDGSVIAGRTRANNDNLRLSALWNTDDLSVQIVPDISHSINVGFSAAASVSDDGNKVAGFYAAGSGVFGAFIADVNTGDVTPLTPDDPNATRVFAGGPRGFSADGSVLVGNYQVPLDGGFLDRGYRYTDAGGFVTLPTLEPDSWNLATSVSPDGNITLLSGGSSEYPNGELYLHDARDGAITRLGSPDPDLTADNFLIGMTETQNVFVSRFTRLDNSRVSYVRNQNGWFGLNAAFEAAGGSLDGWDLDNVTGISRDGRLVFGSGNRDGNTEGFIINFPENFLADYEPEILAGPLDPAIIGGWRLIEGDSTAIVIFTPDGRYAHMENYVGQPESDESTGYELGRYEFGLDGSIRVQTIIDTNGSIGLSDDQGRDDITASIVNGQLTYTVPGEGAFTLAKLEDENSPIVGAWDIDSSGGNDNSNEIVLVAFAADGKSYLLQHSAADEDGQAGIEFSSYTWDANTGAFNASDFVIDQNGQWGLSHPVGDTTVEIQNLGFRLSYRDSEGGESFRRVALLPVDITTQPEGDELDAGETLDLRVEVDGDGPFTYQWRKDGVNIDGAMASTFIIASVTSDDAGTYDVIITGPDGSVLSDAVLVTVQGDEPSDAYLANFSVRQGVATGDVFALPFRVEGEASKMVLLRAIGPTLGNFGVSGVMADPRIRLVDDLGFEVAVNDDWDDPDGSTVASLSSSLGAFGLAADSEDAALVALLPAGSYTMLIDSAGAGGVVLAEIYDADATPGTEPASRLVYLAALGDVSSGSMISGFVVGGTTNSEVVVRAVGSGTGLPGASGNPQLVVNDSSQQVVSQNDDWGTVGDLELDFEDVGAPLLLQGSTDAAEIFEPAPGVYTLQVSGSPGLVLAEVYDFYNRDLATTPVLLIPPRSASVTEGDMARFESYVGGAGPVSVQWVKDGDALSGETSPILDLMSVTASDAGQYVLRLTNAAGTFDAAPVTLTVNPDVQPPSIATQPVDTTIQSGATATLSVVVSSTAGDLTYQWYEGSSGDDSAPISGATSASYTTNALSTTTSYWVRATDSAGGVDSDTATVTVAEPSDIFATHEVVGGGYVAGGTVTISTTFTYTGGASALGLDVTLPAGWSYASTAGSNVPPFPPNENDTGTISWAFISVPASPVSFTYTLNVPGEQTGSVSLAGIFRLRSPDVEGEVPVTVTPNPLIISEVQPFHTADTNGDNRLSLGELLRVIQLYNTRNGTTRTGHYKLEEGTEDGFGPDPSLTSGESGNLSRFHAADTNQDGKLSLGELLRVIQLYNYREGTTRTGEYRVSPGTEDGFAPGPASAD
ncbi:MAG: hypothetical protein SynsKO_28760 [Synoicihabitans sp.]